MSFSATRLHRSLAMIGVADPGSIFDELASAYREPGRHYHGESHISECLNQFARYQHLATNPARVEVAFWFHDAVYDTTRSDNELRSAQWAATYLNEKHVQSDIVDEITDMINATSTHEVNAEDAKIMLDIDLGILGTEPAVFEAYDDAIRAEYHWVPWEQYRQGRAGILRSFLDRERIYHTEPLFAKLEVQARENLARKIEQLSAAA